MDVVIIEREVWHSMMSKLYELCRDIPPLTHCKDGRKWVNPFQAEQILGLWRRDIEALGKAGLIETAKEEGKRSYSLYYNIESFKSLIKKAEMEQMLVGKE